jgi:hypothetical protein
LAALPLLTALVVGCGNQVSRAESTASAETVSSSATVSLTEPTSSTSAASSPATVSPRGEVAGAPFPWSGPYATVTESDSTVSTSTVAPTETTTTAPIPGLVDYGSKMKTWVDNLPQGSWGLFNRPGDIYAGADPMNASTQELAAFRALIDRLDTYIANLEAIKPPSALSAAHADFVASWRTVVRYTNQLFQAVAEKNGSAFADAESTLWEAVDLIQRADAVIGNALGYSLLPES